MFEREPGADRLRLRQGVGWDTDRVGAVQIDQDAFLGAALVADGVTGVDDVRDDERLRVDELLVSRGVRSGVCVPIPEDGGAWGLLCVHDTDPRSLDDGDVDFVRSVANIVGLAVSNLRGSDGDPARDGTGSEAGDTVEGGEGSLEGRGTDLGGSAAGAELAGSAAAWDP